MNFWKYTKALAFTAALGVAVAATTAHAEVKEVRISKGFGILYLPLIVMADQKMLEEQAAKAGLGDIKVNWLMLDGGNVINDAMMAGTLDFAGTGAPGFITLWSKAKGIPNVEVVGVSALSSTSLWLNSNNPKVKTLQDLSPSDKIALPGIKTSLSAVVLQMIAAHEFGRENYAKLDPLTVGLPHPEALAALKAGQTEITTHFTSPPFSYLELQDPKIHRVVNSVDVIGNITLDVTFAPKRFVDANPKTTDAFLAALDEANAFIAKDKKAAAEIYVKNSNVKVSVEDVLAMLEDKDTQFSTTPNKVMDFADFMHLAGTIKVKPATWTDLFIPQLHQRSGS
ncbi:ABC transporter substrate-binding protein [Agrobacterium arsenijevicii]|uniref:Nitrate ABC transporter substrate-binding protein n=1 Tax=Agrobacterium arsenijevicii TaxID=1585697 RepID=A0ABR5D671_9HYPH|nr:nitrate ABC transporter substrate-binding protein [Agrobacterium arsenijevicii]